MKLKGQMMRFLTTILAVCMVFSCSIAAFADSATDKDNNSQAYTDWYYANFYGSEGIIYYGIPHAYWDDSSEFWGDPEDFWQDSHDFIVEYEGETYTYTYKDDKIIFDGKELGNCTGMIVAGVDGNIYFENDKGWLMSAKIGTTTVEFAANKYAYLNFLNGDYETYVIYAYATNAVGPRKLL
ncbi:MAG: hypothetical protein HFJ17_04780 [Clostridia bacterium]|nr:hypothetical protein [Clostridia bacterium]